MFFSMSFRHVSFNSRSNRIISKGNFISSHKRGKPFLWRADLGRKLKIIRATLSLLCVFSVFRCPGVRSFDLDSNKPDKQAVDANWEPCRYLQTNMILLPFYIASLSRAESNYGHCLKVNCCFPEAAKLVLLTLE